MKIYLNATGFDLTTDLEKYANVKIARLARKVPRSLRASAACSVHFTQTRKKGTKFNTCSISFRLDDNELKAEETTLHMYSSLDIAAVHIGHQLKDFVAKRGRRRLRLILRRYFHPR